LPGENDRELVHNALQGNQKAFRQIVERYHATAYAVVRGILGDSDEVDDVLQNVYVKIYRGLAGFRGESRLSTWIYQIARNEAINAVRKRRPVATPVEDVAVPAGEDASPEVRFGRRELSERMEAAMAAMDENYRMVLELRYMGERSYEEIAEMMGLPIGTVKTYIYRGKVQLKKILARRGLAATGKGWPGAPVDKEK
jgi:RNA polymerase sigma-70 factor (ECF subfamily)